MKIITIFNKKEITDQMLSYTDAIIIGLKGLSVNLPVYYEIDEIENIVNRANIQNKEIFISINKNIRNSDLQSLKEILVKLDNMNVKGVIYYDIAIINLKKKLNLKIDLVWGQEHLTTNYYTINYWANKGVRYTLISGEITLDEIKEIKENTDSKLIVPIFGYLPMFTSFRHVVKNYKEFFNLTDDSKINYIEKEDKVYPIVDEENGTVVYSNNILNGIEEYLKLIDINIEYVLINGFNIETDKFIDILKMFKDASLNNVSVYNKKINEICSNTDKGFLYKETIYKVKK